MCPFPIETLKVAIRRLMLAPIQTCIPFKTQIYSLEESFTSFEAKAAFQHIHTGMLQPIGITPVNDILITGVIIPLNIYYVK